MGIEILTAGTLRLLLQPASPELRVHQVPALDLSQVREIERLFETMTA